MSVQIKQLQDRTEELEAGTQTLKRPVAPGAGAAAGGAVAAARAGAVGAAALPDGVGPETPAPWRAVAAAAEESRRRDVELDDAVHVLAVGWHGHVCLARRGRGVRVHFGPGPSFKPCRCWAGACECVCERHRHVYATRHG